MRRMSGSKTRLLILCAVCIVAIGTLGCCDCGDNCCDCENCGSGSELVADHWLVIHNKVKPEVDPTTGDWLGCYSAPTSDDIAFLPGCLDVNKGETLGIANYSDEDVTVNHFSTLNTTNPISIASGEKLVFTVAVESQQLTLDIVGDISHGGPGMVIRP